MSLIQDMNSSNTHEDSKVNLWFLYVLIVVIFCATSIVLLFNRYQSRLNLAQENLHNLARVHNENLLLQMSNIESLIRSTASEFQNTEQASDLQEFVSTIGGNLPHLRTLLVFSADGTVIADSRPDTPALGINAADRNYFIVHRNSRSDTLFIDDPVQSRVDGDWSLPITVGVWNDNDEFLGIVAASLDPIYFSSSLSAFADQDITGYITKDDSTILTTMPYTPDLINTELPPGNLQLSSDVVDPVRINSVLTTNDLVMNRHIESFDLGIVFVQSRAAVLHAFISEVLLTLCVLISLSIITFLVFNRQIQQTRLIQKSAYEIRTLTDNISDFVVRFNRKLQHLYVNPALLASTGMTLDQYIGKTNQELGMPEEQVEFWDKHILHVFETGIRHSIEFNYDTVDGKRWFQARLTPEFNADQEVETVLSVVRDITDSKKAQSELEEKAQILALSLKAAQAGVWVWDTVTNNVQWDDTMEKMHGMSSGSFEGTYEAWRATVHPDDIDSAEESLQKSITGKTSWEEEFRIIQSNGSIRYVLAQAEFIVDSQTDTPIQVVGVNIDITSRKQAEMQLEKRNRYQSIIAELGFDAVKHENLQDFMDTLVQRMQDCLDTEMCKILELQPDGRHLLLRAGAGWRDGIVGKALVETDQGSQAGYTLNTNAPVIVTDLPNEQRFAGPDLLVNHNVSSGMSIVIYTSGEPYGVLGVHSTRQRQFFDIDVTFLKSIAGLLSAVIDRHQAQSDAIQERNLLRLLIDNVPDYIFVKDTEGRFIETNLAHARAAGLEREQLIGKTALETFSDDLASQFHSDDNLILNEGRTIVNEERQTTDSEGNLRWVLTTKLPLRNGDGITGLVGISRDITDRLEAEKKRLEAERVRIEMQEQRKVIDLKERFIATAAHDFRTPLSVIQVNASLLERYIDQFTKQKMLSKIQQIQAQVGHVTSLINDVLTISKSHAQKTDLTLKTINLHDFCQEIWSNMVTLDSGAHLKKLNFNATLDQFIGDPRLLRQAFDNLLNNALKYTPEGKLIQCEVSNDDKFVTFTITDQGYGIPEEDIDHLFEPFHRARNVTNIKGTGLGLAIVKDFIELHNGCIAVVSEEGKGTTFTVQIPIVTEIAQS